MMLESSDDPASEGAFRIEEERPAPDVTVLVVHGDADLHTSPELRERLGAAIDAGDSSIVVDLTKTSFLDSTALGVLLGAVKRLGAGEARIQVVVSRPEIRRIFEITLLDQVLPLAETRAEALAAASAGVR
jgi:anti-sigma B factor antagonist